MFFLTPKYLKQGKLYIKEAEKRVSYHRDRWSEGTVADFEGQIVNLKKGVKARDRAGVDGAERALEKLCETHCPLGKDAWMSENVEVFLVAIIVALGIRTYFVQPFTIPTSSMFPTLNGITGKRTEGVPPNPLLQVLQFATHGRTWHDVVAEADERVRTVEDAPRGGLRRFFTYTRIVTDLGNEYWVNESKDPVENAFGKSPNGRGGFSLVGNEFKKGEPIARGYTDTGDHVFVDKMSYHFRKPRRGEVFVFNTENIPKMGNLGPPPAQPSQFYIKRLVALPGDTLRIEAPELFINGKRAEGLGYERVMEGRGDAPVNGGYRGYSQGPNGFDDYNLTRRTDTFTLPDDAYFAMGDNSHNSSDSRYWGTVPQENLMGAGLLVYWPFLRDGRTHFGLIR